MLYVLGGVEGPVMPAKCFADALATQIECPLFTVYCFGFLFSGFGIRVSGLEG